MSKQLLAAVTKLLVLADLIDVQVLLKQLRQVEDDLERVRNTRSSTGWVRKFQSL